jgi:hypothetical protein
MTQQQQQQQQQQQDKSIRFFVGLFGMGSPLKFSRHLPP